MAVRINDKSTRDLITVSMQGWQVYDRIFCAQQAAIDSFINENVLLPDLNTTS